MNEELTKQIDNLRAEWARAPFTARAVAGAYVPPMLDLLDTMRMHVELLAVEVANMKEHRKKGLEAMRNVIANGEAMGAFPDWMLGELKQMAGEESNV